MFFLKKTVMVNDMWVSMHDTTWKSQSNILTFVFSLSLSIYINFFFLYESSPTITHYIAPSRNSDRSLKVEAEVTLRSSGTEPKIKFYSEMHSHDDVQLRTLVRHVVLRLLDPVTHGLEMRPEDKELLS